MNKKKGQGLKEDSKKKKAVGYRYVICFVIFAGYILVFFHRLCPAVIALDMQKAFGASVTLLGMLGSAYFYSYALMQLPTGLLVDSWGPRKTVSSFFLLAAGGSVVMGMAPTLTIAILGRIMVGIGVSTLFVSNFKLLAEWFNPRQFVIMGGIFMAVGGIGALCASAPLAWVSDMIGWRMTFIAVGMATLIMALLAYGLVRDRPLGAGPHTNPGPGAGREIGLLKGIGLVAGSGRFWPIAICSFFPPGISFALGGLWGGPFLMHVYGLSKAAAGGVLSMFAFALITGGPFHGWIANRIGRKADLIGSNVILIVVCCFFYAFTNRLSMSMLYALFFAFFFFGVAFGPIVITACKELFPLSIAGTSAAMANFFSFFGGAFFQVFVGVILSRGSHPEGQFLWRDYQNMFLVYLAASIISLVAAFFLKETLVKVPPENATSP